MKNNKNGFALPTVLIASIVMLTVLLVAVASVSTIRASLNSQYYTQLANSAGEAGVAYAKACLESNNNIPQWSDGHPLTPATDCAGQKLAACNLTKPPDDCFVINDEGNLIQSTFEVGCPPTAVCDGTAKVYDIASVGTTKLLRQTDKSIWRKYSQTARLSRFEVQMDWIQVSAGFNQTCAIDRSHKAYCWGQGWLGGGGDIIREKDENGNLVQVGNVLSRQSAVPVPVQSSLGMTFGNVKSISVGLNHVCMLNTDGKAYCWGGTNSDGQFGIGSPTDGSLYPVPVLSSLVFDSITAGELHTCAVSVGQAYCWGANDSGQLGVADLLPRNTPAVVMMSSSGVFNKTTTAISAGQSHTCAVTTESTANAYCWGKGMFGRLGRGNETPINYAVAVKSGVGDAMNGKKVTAISAGQSHTCAVADSRAYCWGNNGAGKLGNGDANIIQSLVPLAVKSAPGQNWNTDVLSVTAGGSHTCAIASVGAVYCWGYNSVWEGLLSGYSDFVCLYGLLGASRLEDSKTVCVSDYYSTVPVPVVASGVLKGKTISALTLGTTHSCAFGNGSIYCWGDNSYSQLGATTVPRLLYPTQPADEGYKYSPVPIPTTVPSVPIYF